MSEVLQINYPDPDPVHHMTEAHWGPPYLELSIQYIKHFL